MIKNVLCAITAACLLALVSCKKEDSNTSLGGDTNIALTAVDSVSSVYIELDDQNDFSTEIKIKSNIDGVVTYSGSVDLKTLPTEFQAKAMQILTEHGEYYNASEYVTVTNDLIANFEFKLKITSEGYLDYFTDGKPWVMVRYDDPVGTTYTITNDNNETLTRTITEKTGQDEWPLGFFLIKTIKVEQTVPSDDPLIDHIEYRVNHKFGLVYLEYFFKDGTKMDVDVIPWYVF